MASKWDTVANGVNLTAKIVVSVLWAAGAIAGFALGQPIIGIVATLYLVYLWVFGGRWLIY